MKIVTEQFGVRSTNREQMIDITGEVNSLIGQSGIREGVVLVYCPHTTAGITINENADPDVVSDILMMLSKLVPSNISGYRHSEGNSDAHIKSSIVGCSEQLLVKGGSLELGTWQGVYFCEFDGPRSRRVFVQIRGQ
jgi:secondary thiamine-phosphate synthase enzyme